MANAEHWLFEMIKAGAEANIDFVLISSSVHVRVKFRIIACGGWSPIRVGPQAGGLCVLAIFPSLEC